MYNGLIITKDAEIRQECRKIISRSGNIKSIIVSKIDDVDVKQSYFNYLFILISELDQEVLKQLGQAYKMTPSLSTIYYNRSLTLSNLDKVGEKPTLNFIVGERREQNFLRLLSDLKKNYWRKIPYDEFEIDFEALSPRMKKTMKFIESEPVSKCNIVSISSYLNISPGYFSQEFKRETGQSFRSFMQHVIHYYEDIILSKVNLPAKNISQLLGYSELSSFSRSFKKRNGISPTKYKKLMKVY